MRRHTILSLCLFVFFQVLPGHAQEPNQAQASAQAAPQQAAQPVQQRPVAAAEGYEGGDGAFSLGLFYWYNPAHAGIRTGKMSTATNPSVFNFPATNKNGSPWLMMSVPVGKHHSLRFSYFRTQSQGNKVLDNDINLFGPDFLRGQYLSAGYTLQNGKVSLDYTSWPFPVNNSRFRLKTLWEVQYTAIRAAVDAPLEPTEDADGNFVTRNADRSRWFVYPTFGLGIEYFLTRRFRFEAKGSGFAFPGRSNVWDADGFFAYRSGKLEINFGGRAFHFRTSPKEEEYFRGTLPGAYVGLRWYP